MIISDEKEDAAKLSNDEKIVEQLPKENIVSSDDEELLKFLEQTRPKIYVVGTGGSGCNTLERMNELGIEGVKLFALNTDVRHLVKVKADKKCLIGKKTTNGMGAGSNPQTGEAAAKESEDEIKSLHRETVTVTANIKDLSKKSEDKQKKIREIIDVASKKIDVVNKASTVAEVDSTIDNGWSDM